MTWTPVIAQVLRLHLEASSKLRLPSAGVHQDGSAHPCHSLAAQGHHLLQHLASLRPHNLVLAQGLGFKADVQG